MLPRATFVTVRIGQREKLGDGAVFRVTQLMLKGDLKLGWPFGDQIFRMRPKTREGPV